MDNKQNEQFQNTDCFKPEETIGYPLCVGNGTEECESCCLYTDFDDEDYY